MSTQSDRSDDDSGEAIQAALSDLVSAAERRNLSVGRAWDVSGDTDGNWMVELTRVERPSDAK